MIFSKLFIQLVNPKKKLKISTEILWYKKNILNLTAFNIHSNLTQQTINTTLDFSFNQNAKFEKLEIFEKKH
ncbi:hypothetical protein BpHYR1_033521 [Brachionus plicatilis]|uniref:Uncharacterized protein n=1 Tax=Brachionus plicatilis TaxID=10195 RepID=A0A3M7SGJ1_BRAPC|nr:hypothetical protein BpHYR1_033521 [Brachionus plicatilis]